MATYNENFPADDEYLIDFPSKQRSQQEALKDNAIVNAGRVEGKTVGNNADNIPLNNGTVNTNLNADTVDGKHANEFSLTSHSHNNVTTSASGFMSGADKTKLNGIATGAEVNQNAFSNIKVGDVTVQADNKTDTVELVAGSNVTITPDATNDKITIASTNTVTTATTTGTGNAVTAITASNGALTVTKGSTFSTSDHKHGAGDITSGTLAVARGGTGQTSLGGACNAMINALGTGTSTPVDADYYVSQYVGGGNTTTDFYRRPMSALWAYIKGKADATYSVSGHTHSYLALSGGTITGVVYNKNTGITRATAPSANQSRWITLARDKNDKPLGGVYWWYNTDKTGGMRLYAYNHTSTTDTNAYIGIQNDTSGNLYTVATTPATADNSTKIATTAFVKAQGYLTSHQSIAGKADKTSITAGTAGTSSATSGSTIAIPYVTVTAQGVVSGYGTHTHTVSGFLTSSSTASKATGDENGNRIYTSYASSITRTTKQNGNYLDQTISLKSKSGAVLSSYAISTYSPPCSSCSCSCSCIIQGNILTNKGYIDIKDLKENDYIIDNKGNACKVKGIVKHMLGDRKVVALGECIITDDHLVMQGTPSAYNVNRYHKNKMIVCKADNNVCGYYPNEQFVDNLNAITYEMDSNTIVYLPIVENAEWCIVNGNIIACARWNNE